MRLPHRLQGQKVKSQGEAGAYCGGHLAAQLVNDCKKSQPEDCSQLTQCRRISVWCVRRCHQKTWHVPQHVSHRHLQCRDTRSSTCWWHLLSQQGRQSCQRTSQTGCTAPDHKQTTLSCFSPNSTFPISHKSRIKQKLKLTNNTINCSKIQLQQSPELNDIYIPQFLFHCKI